MYILTAADAFASVLGIVAKLGRNDPCPCGSGKKVKKCHHLGGSLEAEALILFKQNVAEQEQIERQRLQKFGHVRPVISTMFKGERFVAVGGGLYHSDQWKTVPDFLFFYIKQILGGDWGTDEIATLPVEQRHPMLQWYDSTCRLQERHKETKNAEGLYHGHLDGPTTAYLRLAYDLYLVADHQKLQASLVARLKHRDQFQGARYELRVASHCIQAGFSIEHEDESDGSSQHPEFVATHKASGQVIAVEAKSRHRPGVLGQPGPPEDDPRADVRKIVLKALRKADAIAHPYAVFVDVNLPAQEITDIRELGWIQDLIHEIKRPPPTDESGRDRYNLLMFTNYPHHYGAEAAPPPQSGRVSVIPPNPKVAVQYPEALKALHDAALSYGSIPNWFDE